MIVVIYTAYLISDVIYLCYSAFGCFKVFVVKIMAKLDKFFEDRDDEEYPIAIQKVNVMIYDAVEAQKEKSGGGKVTMEIMKLMRKGFDYINIRLVKAHRESVANETKVRTMITDSKAYEALVRRVSGGESRLSEFPALKRIDARRDEGFSVMVTPTEEENLETIKKDLKQIWKVQADTPSPYDVATTKTGNLILRVKTREETDRLKTVIENVETIKDKIKVTVPKRRRQRLLILSVDSDVEDDDIKRSVVQSLSSEGVDVRECMDIVRHYPTKSGKENWVLDVDDKSAELLISGRRICINLERYRVVRFVPIVRCFRCQAFGHVISRCTGEECCVKCSGKHGLKDCTVDTEVCVNCQRADDGSDIKHRADNSECPCYQRYRTDLLASRL